LDDRCESLPHLKSRGKNATATERLFTLPSQRNSRIGTSVTAGLDATLVDSSLTSSDQFPGPGQTVAPREQACSIKEALDVQAGHGGIERALLSWWGAFGGLVLLAGTCLLLATELPGAWLDRGLALVGQKTEEALFARELRRLTESLDLARTRLQESQSRRDALAARLATLAQRQAEASARAPDLLQLVCEQSTGDSRRRQTVTGLTAYLELERERALLGAELPGLTETLQRANQELARFRSELETRATELLVLQARAERRSLDLALTDLERSIPGRDRLGQALKLLGAGQSFPGSP
jgi:hypothetical protein